MPGSSSSGFVNQCSLRNASPIQPSKYMCGHSREICRKSLLATYVHNRNHRLYTNDNAANDTLCMVYIQLAACIFVLEEHAFVLVVDSL